MKNPRDHFDPSLAFFWCVCERGGKREGGREGEQEAKTKTTGKHVRHNTHIVFLLANWHQLHQFKEEQKALSSQRQYFIIKLFYLKTQQNFEQRSSTLLLCG